MDSITPLLIAKALDGLHLRQLVTAENIANANSPGYRPLTVSFEARLQAAAKHGADAIAQVTPQIEQAAPSAPRELRLDLEVATASQTALRYAALIDLLGRELAIHRTVMAGGR